MSMPVTEADATERRLKLVTSEAETVGEAAGTSKISGTELRLSVLRNCQPGPLVCGKILVTDFACVELVKLMDWVQERMKAQDRMKGICRTVLNSSTADQRSMIHYCVP